MATVTFNDLITGDIQNVFLSGDFSRSAVYTTDGVPTDISVQFFEGSLDRMDTSYNHAWCDFADISNVKENQDTLEVNGVVYVILEASPDELQQGLNLFLQEVA